MGDRLREAMDADGVSIRQLAADLGVTDGLVGKWRSGKTIPSTENLLKLSARFGRPLSFFFEQHRTAA